LSAARGRAGGLAPGPDPDPPQAHTPAAPRSTVATMRAAGRRRRDGVIASARPSRIELR
jgi:hypothetical protein